MQGDQFFDIPLTAEERQQIGVVWDWLEANLGPIGAILRMRNLAPKAAALREADTINLTDWLAEQMRPLDPDELLEIDWNMASEFVMEARRDLTAGTSFETTCTKLRNQLWRIGLDELLAGPTPTTSRGSHNRS